MEILNQEAKKQMEGCKARAKEAGLSFENDTLEYIVSNRDLVELSPKNMIPTLYDYWLHDVELLKEMGRYELYPNNPYETVINTRPPMSFYNDNNPQWLNVMIFYHVLGHIDFFQNNMHFQHTKNDDFAGKALADKRKIASLRSKHGRWVDYIIEFSRGIDNITNLYAELSENNSVSEKPNRLDFYFGHFLQNEKKVGFSEFQKELEKYNNEVDKGDDFAEMRFFSKLHERYPEFESVYKLYLENFEEKPKTRDVMEFIMENSEFVNRRENKWMRSIMKIVRDTSLYFAPQIRTKIFNEGWASYWHEKLFLNDDRIKGHETDFAKTHARVTALPRKGLNPYAIGMRLIEYIKEEADKGRNSYEFEKLKEINKRENFDAKTGKGLDYIFELRKNYNDFMLINSFVDQDFVDKYKLFVSGKRMNPYKGVWEYYVKSRNAKDYKKMLLNQLYHPPDIQVKSSNGNKLLVLEHNFEGKQLVPEYIKNVMIGIEYLWNGPVKLNTHILDEEGNPKPWTYYVKEREVKGKERR